MNYPSKEERDAFLADIRAVVAKHGIGMSLSGFEYETELVPAADDDLVGEIHDLITDPPQPGIWDDVLHYGPPVPREIRQSTAMGALALAFEDQLRGDLQHGLFAYPVSLMSVVAPTAWIKQSGHNTETPTA